MFGFIQFGLDQFICVLKYSSGNSNVIRGLGIIDLVPLILSNVFVISVALNVIRLYHTKLSCDKILQNTVSWFGPVMELS